MKKQTRMRNGLRADQIVDEAIALVDATGQHYTSLSRDAIAARCGVTGTAVQYHFPTMAQLRRAIMRAAVKQDALLVIAQGLVEGNPQALKAGPRVKAAAMKKVTQ
jgi:AcrR family transcriptional regulator